MMAAVRYRKSMGEEEKERIVKEFLPFIRYAANRLSWRLPPQLTVDDLVSAGLMGLLDALDKFEHGRVKLKTYAEHRIKGAMLDEIRAMDWVPRSVKKKMSSVRNAQSDLERELGRTPEDEEIAGALDLTLDEYYRTLQDARGAVSLRFEDFEENGASGEGMNILECLADPNSTDPLNELEIADRKRLLARLIDELPEKEKLILSLYYWEELTMKEIGKIMGITEGRVCQLHGQSLLRLKSNLAIQKNAKEAAVKVR